MKQKTILTIMIMIFAFVVNAQEHDVEAEFGDGTRAVSGARAIDFGIISEDYTEKTLNIINVKPSSMKIISISFTGGGVGVTIIDNVIKAHSNADIIISVSPEYIAEEDFVRYMLITTECKYLGGVIVTEESVYKIKGTIEKE